MQIKRRTLNQIYFSFLSPGIIKKEQTNFVNVVELAQTRQYVSIRLVKTHAGDEFVLTAQLFEELVVDRDAFEYFGYRHILICAKFQS